MADFPAALPPGMPPGYESEASAAWDNVLSSVHMGESGSMTGTRESTHDVGEVAGSTVRGGANVRSPVQTLAIIGASELGGGGGGGRGLGGDGVGSEYEGHDSGLSTVFSILLAAKFGAALQPERYSVGRTSRAGSPPTRAALSSPTHSAPPSPPQSPTADGSSPGSKPSGRLPLSRQNTQSCRSSEASSTVVRGSLGGTPPGPSRRGLGGHQRTRGAKLVAASSAAATSVKAATAAAKAAPTRCLGCQRTHSALDKEGSASHKRFGLSCQRTHSALSSTSPKATKLTNAALSPEEEAKARVDPPC